MSTKGSPLHQRILTLAKSDEERELDVHGRGSDVPRFSQTGEIVGILIFLFELVEARPFDGAQRNDPRPPSAEVETLRNAGNSRIAHGGELLVHRLRDLACVVHIAGDAAPLAQ